MYGQKAVIFGILLIGCLLITGIGYAATINAASCSQADVQAAVDSANSGDTVLIPATNCMWSSNVTVNKTITIQGAGSSLTKIQRSSGPFFISNSGNPRITGLHLEASGTAENYIQIKGTGGWRVDNCRLNNTTTNSRVGIYVKFNSTDGQPVGLIDNNIFNNCRIYVQCALTSVYHILMDDNSLLGSAWTVYIEDNEMDRTGYASIGGAGNVVDSQYGGSYVYRFNKVVNAHIEVHAPGGGDAPGRAGRYWEIYGNSMSHPSNNWDRAIFIRGGTGVVFGNEITDGGFSSNRIDLDIHVKRSGSCNGSSIADGNTIGESGWPCRDQIGRATDEFLWKSGGPVPDQASEPAYFWDNTGFSNTTVSIDGDESYIQQNRDYYEDDDNGVRKGILANRPATCTTGQSYWATDQGNWNQSTVGMNGYDFGQGVLYKCTSINTWELYYTPYEYPHPLRTTWGDIQPPQGDIQTPQNLGIIN